MTGCLRLLSFLEGLSFILLLLIAMPLKYLWNIPSLVPYAGMFHGAMFVAFLLALLVICQLKAYPLKIFLLGFVASFVPFMPFWFERYIHRLEQAELVG